MKEFKNSFRKLVLVMVDIGGGCLEKIKRKGVGGKCTHFQRISVHIYFSGGVNSSNIS